VSKYQKGKTNLDFTEARDSEWHQLGHMQVCISLQTDNHASTPPLSFLQAGCPSCRPTNSVKALKACCITGKMNSVAVNYRQDFHTTILVCFEAAEEVTSKVAPHYLLLWTTADRQLAFFLSGSRLAPSIAASKLCEILESQQLATLKSVKVSGLWFDSIHKHQICRNVRNSLWQVA